MKIVFYKDGFIGPVSGSDELMIKYAMALQSSGHDATVLVLKQFSTDNDHYRRLLNAGIQVTVLTALPYYFVLRALRKVTSILPNLLYTENKLGWEKLTYSTALHYFRQHRPDVLHVILANSMVIQAAHEAGIPVLYQEIATPWYAPEVKSYYDTVESLLPRFSEIVGLSPTHAKLCRDRFSYSGPISILPFIGDSPESQRGTHSNQNDRIIFGYAARLERLKGIFVLLEAFARLYQERPDVYLHIAGNGPHESEAIEQAARLGISDRCKFLGPYSGARAKADFMQSIDVLVHPSFAEGTPNTIIEAMANGLPVIASAVGGIPDMISDEMGIIVPPGDVSSLADALKTLSDDGMLRQSMRAVSLRRFESIFSEEAVMPLMLSLYERAMGRASAGRDHSLLQMVDLRHPWVEPAK